MTVDGKIYGFPDDGDVFVMYYRKDVLTDPAIQAAYKEKYGSDLPVPPTTWSEFDQAVAVITETTGGKPYGCAFFRDPPYAQFMFQERFRNNGGRFFDAGTMKAAVNGPPRRAGVQRLAGREQGHAEGRGDLGLRREPGRVPPGRLGDDHLLAAVRALGRRLRHRPGGAGLGAEEHGREPGRLFDAARRASTARRGLRPQHRLGLEQEGPGLPVHPMAEQPGDQPPARAAPLRVARPVPRRPLHLRGTSSAGPRHPSISRRCRPGQSTGCSTFRSSRPTSTRRCGRASPSWAGEDPQAILDEVAAQWDAITEPDRGRQAACRLRGVGREPNAYPPRHEPSVRASAFPAGRADRRPGAGRLSGFADRRFVLAITPAVVVILLIGLFPIVYTAVVSFQNINMLEEDTSFSGLMNYARLLHDARFWQALLHVPVPRRRPAGRAGSGPAAGLPVPRAHARPAGVRGAPGAAGGDLADHCRGDVAAAARQPLRADQPDPGLGHGRGAGRPGWSTRPSSTLRS